MTISAREVLNELRQGGDWNLADEAERVWENGETLSWDAYANHVIPRVALHIREVHAHIQWVKDHQAA